MTHGALVISRKDDDRRILLYTVHSGYLIPEIIAKAPAFLAKHRFSFLGEKQHAQGYKTRSEFDHFMRQSFDDGGLDYAPCVAGLLCAVYPWVLYPVPLNFMKDSCHYESHIDNADRLILSRNHWEYRDPNAQLISSFRPVDLMLDWTWNNIINAENKDRK